MPNRLSSRFTRLISEFISRNIYKFIILGLFLFGIASISLVIFTGIVIWPILPWVFAGIVVATPILLILNNVLGVVLFSLNRSPISDAKSIIQETPYTQIKQILEWLSLNKPSLVTRKTLNLLDRFISADETRGFIDCIGDCLKELGNINNGVLLTEKSLAALVKAKQNVQFILRALNVFSEYNSKLENTNKFLLTTEIFEKLIALGPNAANIARSLVDLRFDLRLKENFELIYVINRPGAPEFTERSAQKMVSCINLLASRLLLTPRTRQMLFEHHRSTMSISSIIRNLDALTPTLLNQRNLETIGGLLQEGQLGFNNFFEAFIELWATHGGVLITQDNFNRLAISRTPIDTARAIIRDHALDQRLQRIAEQAQRAAERAQHVGELLQRAGQQPRGLPALLQRPGIARDTQSTHIKSVHKSTSESAVRLMQRYGEIIKDDKLQTIYQEMVDWSERLKLDAANNQDIVDDVNKIFQEEFQPPRPAVSPDFIFDSIRACITRLTANDFTDPASQVSIRQLMALAWAGLHDDTTRTADLKDALAQLAVGFCEIATEYPSYTGEGYRPACPGGTFNKIIQTLVGSHPDAKLVVLTEGAAAEKLPIVVHDEAYKYLITPSNSGLIADVEKDGVAVIWDTIRKSVEDRMRDDFSSVYEGAGGDARFQGLIACGADIDLPEDFFERLRKHQQDEPGAAASADRPRSPRPV